MKRTLLTAVMLFASLAWADIGKITVVDGSATRAPKGGQAEALKVGSSIELGDTLEVASGNLKLQLTDESVIILGPKSKLEITEAEFEGQERKGFSALLSGGSLWTKVKKALGGAKYEVKTERAVAGVRGTIFRIDADQLVKAAKTGGKARTASVVRVVDGVVNVRPTDAVIKASKGQKAAPKPKGPRVQVAGPQEVSADEWEKRFVDLQKNAQVVVGIDLWEQAEFEQSAKADAFAKGVEKNQ